MGDNGISQLSLLFLLKKALDKLLEKGVAVSAAAVRRNNSYEYKYKFSDWDSRCESCLKEETNEEDERER